LNALLAGLTFTPAANFNSSFGIGLSLSDGIAPLVLGAKSVTGAPVNDPPEGVDDSCTQFEDGDCQMVTDALDVGFADIQDAPAADHILGIVIASLPDHGTLIHNGSPAEVGEFIPWDDVSGGGLYITPEANSVGSPYTSFTFQVQDDGGTDNGGVDLDPTPDTFTANLTPVNDAPTGTDNTVTTD
jgi:hypothetical protein